MTQFCFPGQNGVLPCPCGNPPVAPGLGCDNFGAGPAESGEIDASGAASLAQDTVVLEVTGTNNTSLTVFWQGTGFQPEGFVHGAGIRCVLTNLKRLYTGSASSGAIARAGAGDSSVSARSAELGSPIPLGHPRHYFAVCRDPNAAGACGNPAATVNVTNAGTIVWGP